MKFKKIYAFFLLPLMLLVSCNWGMENNNKDNNDGHISIIRLDKLLNEYVELNSFSALQKMSTEHAIETKLLIEDILELGQVNDNNINTKLKEYYGDSTLQVLMRDAIAKYNNMELLEKKFSMAFKRLKSELPHIKVPVIYAQISALNGSVVVGDSLLGFSIDKYMGEDYPLYKKYYYDYQRRSMSPERIVPDCFNYYLMSEYPFPVNNRRTLLDLMLHYGKIHYVVGKVMDCKTFEEELGYTKEETDWCKANKKSIWTYMVDNNHIFATDPMVIRKYTKPAPYTSFFGDGSPSVIGLWVGVQIIDSYMRNNRDVTIQELLANTDYNQMLADANFNP